MNVKVKDVQKDAEHFGFKLHKHETRMYKWSLTRDNMKGAISFKTLDQVVIYLVELNMKKINWDRVYEDIKSNVKYDF